MKLRKAALLLALLSAFAALGAQPSFADSQIKESEVGPGALGGVGGASATFQSWGEKFRLWDTDCDGRGVYIRYSIGTWDSHDRYVHWHGGCGSMAFKNLDLREGAQVSYTVCVGFKFGTDRCSGTEFDKA
jgi:hypothetical protein